MSTAKSGKSSKKYKRLQEFLVDADNMLAYRVVDNLIKSSATEYNPLVLFGASGSGKTHLLESIVQGLRRSFNKHSVIFADAEGFYSTYTQALHDHQYQSFRNQYRNCRALVLDNMHQLEKKKSTQQELLFTVNELVQKGRLFIAGSQINPRDLHQFDAALINRLESGLAVQVKPVSKNVALAHYQKIAERLSIHLSSQLVESVWNEYNGSFGEFKEKFERLLLFCRENNQHVTAPLLRNFMVKYRRQKQVVDKNVIFQAVAAYYGLEDMYTISTTGKKRSLREPKYVCMALLKDLLAITNQEIRKDFGDCSESAVRYALNKVKQEKKLLEVYKKLQGQLGGE